MKPFAALALAGALLGSAAGCSVTALADRERSRAVNECASDDDCGAGACRSGICVATQGSFAALLFELTPTAKADRLGGKPQFEVFDIPTAGGDLDLKFGGIFRLTIKITAPMACRSLLFEARSGIPVKGAMDGTIPARVTLVPDLRRLGLGVESYTAEVDTSVSENPTTPIGAKSYEVNLGVPTGYYDIYIEPRPVLFDESATPEQRARCSLPQQLLRRQAVGRSDITLTIDLPTAAELDLEVRFPPAQSLAGWQLDMLEPNGSLISNRVAIPTDAKSNYPARLSYYPVAISGTGPDATADRSGSELVRISPPAGTVAPTLLFERRALELLEPGTGLVEPLLRLPTPVTVEGQVRTRDSIEPVRGSVTLTATRVLAAPPGVFAAFSAQVRTDRDGRFSATLVPGTYRVQVVPEQTGGEPAVDLKLSSTTWEVPAEPRLQSGRVVAVDPVLLVSGTAVLRWNNAGALGAIVGVDPSVPIPSPDVLERSLGAASIPPRAARTAIDNESGDFSFAADPGKLDLFVRPPDASGLAWLVMPDLVLADASTPRTDIGVLSLPLPIRLEGDAYLSSPSTTSSATLAQSHLIAYALVDAEGKPVADEPSAHRAVRIAEGRLDANGHYQLSVPAELNGPTKL